MRLTLFTSVIGLVLSVNSSLAYAKQAEKSHMNEALTFNEDGAKRYAGIHWPDGFHLEQADLFAHNEIVVHASCEKVFANIVDAQVWPSWYPNSHNVKLLNRSDGKLHEGARFSCMSSFQTAA
jgi:hypothetical protein